MECRSSSHLRPAVVALFLTTGVGGFSPGGLHALHPSSIQREITFKMALSVDIPLPIAERLEENGIIELNALQKLSIDTAQRGIDMIIHAETGSGKTLCFALPLLQQLSGDMPLQGLVLVPTLELAAQTTRVLNALQPGSAAALSRDTHELPLAPILIGPPTMVLRMLQAPGGWAASLAGRPDGAAPAKPITPAQKPPPQQRTASLLPRERIRALRCVVLDEADAMIMPLGRYATHKQKAKRETSPKEAATLVRLLCEQCKPLPHEQTEKREGGLQVLAASATVGRPLRRELASLCGRSFEILRAEDATAAQATEGAPGAGVRPVGLAAGISISVVTSDRDNWLAALHDVLRTERSRAPLFFTRPGRSLASEIGLLKQCDLDARTLEEAVLAQEEITARTAIASASTSTDGRSADPSLLVATPSGARGLDLHGVDLVVILGVPASADALVHLAGRTARQGLAGKVVMLADTEEADARLPALGAQLGVDFRKDRRHVAERAERWVQMLQVHEKIVGAERKGI
jgi:superfamily II DNA/RNA helicase